MKLLHLFSNHKPTGPAEPAVRLAAALRDRGHEVLFAHAAPPRPNAGYMDSRAAEYDLEATSQFALNKHFKTLSVWRDARRIARFIDARGFDIVHCHLLNDHLTAALAARKCAARPAIVRTNHDAVPMRPHLRNRFLFPKRTDALIELSQAALEQDVRTFRFPREHTAVIDTSVDLARFDPEHHLPDMRPRFGVNQDAFVVGIAARIQGRRRFDVLLDAAAIARTHVPGLRLVIIGRGTHKETVAVRPAAERGLAKTVVFPGYLRGEDYVAGLLSLDAKIFLVPGTDGSCRAAREAMALGKPVIAARRGMLPELVADGETGLVVDDTPENLAEAIIRLARDRGLCRNMGVAARRTALDRFDPARQAERVELVYRKLLGRG